MLKNGTYTITWSGTNSNREASLLPVRVPLFAGLLGIRMPVIRRSDKPRFDLIRNDSDLKQLVACQGDQWPDSDILEANGYQVERVTSFERMYRMLEAGRCDYFPRGITEIYGELERNVYPGLMAYDRVLLSYTFPMYFFVAHGNEELARILEARLTQFAESGDLQAYLRLHPVTRGPFRWHGSVIRWSSGWRIRTCLPRHHCRTGPSGWNYPQKANARLTRKPRPWPGTRSLTNEVW